MSFWNELAQGFAGLPVMPRPVPDHIRRHIRRVNTWLEAKQVTDFLANNFGNLPKTPVLRIPPSELIGPEYLVNTFAYYLPTSSITESISPPIDRSRPEVLVGTVRYRLWARSQPVPSLTGIEDIPENCQNIFAVDCFCVDRRFRLKGRKIGTWLLKYLHYFANTNAIPYAVFMKEGRPLTIPIWHFRSGIYAWTKVQQPNPSSSIKHLTEDKALMWLKNYYNLKNLDPSAQFSNRILKSSDNPSLYPMTHNSQNSRWYLYRDSVSFWILIRVENTNQEHKDGGKIGYFTDIYISNMFSSDKVALSSLLKDIANMIGMKMGYSTIWLDSDFVLADDQKTGSDWSIDGPYSWYSFQW